MLRPCLHVLVPRLTVEAPPEDDQRTGHPAADTPARGRVGAREAHHVRARPWGRILYQLRRPSCRHQCAGRLARGSGDRARRTDHRDVVAQRALRSGVLELSLRRCRTGSPRCSRVLEQGPPDSRSVHQYLAVARQPASDPRPTGDRRSSHSAARTQPRRRAASKPARHAGGGECRRTRRHGAHPILVGQHGRTQRRRADPPQRDDEPRGHSGRRDGDSRRSRRQLDADSITTSG